MKKQLSLIASLALFTTFLIVPLSSHAAPEEYSSLTETKIEVEINKGKVVDLPRPVISVLLAGPSIADVEARSPKQLFIYGKTIGETTVYAFDEKDRKVLSAIIKVTHNLSALNSQVKAVQPSSKVKINSSDRGLVVSGDVESPQDAENVMRLVSGYTSEKDSVVNMMNVKGSSQVALRVRIAEVQKTNLKNFGINLQNLITRGSFSIGFGTGRDFVDDDGITLLPGDAHALVFSHGGPNLNGMLEALEREGMARTLAEPNLTTISGKPASFLAGGEIPIPVPEDDGKTSIEYHQFGVSLNFTPTVINKNRISLGVKPEVSSVAQTGAITFNGFSVPSFSVRRADTTVELGSGQSIAIAGLLQSEASNQISKFPWLGDVPILGTLFSSSDFQNNETELVIIVTPYIVSPVDEANFALPGENLVQPSDFERIFLGKVYGYRGNRQTPEGSDIAVPEIDLSTHHGKIGFIVE